MDRPVPFISRVRLKNYKSIAACDVRLWAAHNFRRPER
jgi:hypothetical protein